MLLNQKLTKADTSARESYKNKSDETFALKAVIKNRNQDLEDLKKELNNKGKVIKDKEKELYRLDQKCTNLEECFKKIQVENKDLKAKNKNVLKDKTRKASKSYSVPISAVSATTPKSSGTTSTSTVSISPSTMSISYSTTTPPPRNPPWSPAIIRDVKELSCFRRCIFTSISTAMNDT